MQLQLHPFFVRDTNLRTFFIQYTIMKRGLLLVPAAMLVALLLAFTLHKEKTATPSSVTGVKEYKTKYIVRCGPDWELLKDWIEEVDIPPIPGAGNYKWKISTKNDSAQFYFNQGLNMYYSFHIIEAMASFKKATRFDPDCAMLYWAQALAYGPNINDIGYTASYDAFLAAGRAIESCGNCTEQEQLLIRAQRSRYTGDSAENRKKLNQVYIDGMKEAYDQFPNDPDVAALYADAMMLQHPWDLWKNDGTPKPWTPLIREVLEKLLAKTPNHPGANHYYIHVMEPSPYAAKALPSADRLGKLTPGLSHTVHMPSHIYLRTGNYDKGVSVNEKAVNSYKKTIPMFAPVTGADFLYIIHNLHMKTNHAMLAGRSVYSFTSAQETVNSIPKDYLSAPGALGNALQYIYMIPALVNVRFGEWEKILESPEPNSSMKYASVLYHFALGMAKACKLRTDDAKGELKLMQDLMKDSSLTIPFTPFSAAIEGAIVAENLLAGTIALKEKRMNDAIAAFTKAVITEENMVYDEPRDWLLNPKHYLCNAYLENGNGVNAEKVARKDILNNNENGWALYGLYKALIMQKKNTEAGKILVRYKQAFSKADIKPAGPVM
jgi:tetratricopeptide (TPR) repeat protein